MNEHSKKRTTLPAKEARGYFVQTDRAAHEAWALFGMKYPTASALLHFLAANVGDENAVVASHKTLADFMGSSPSTIKRSLKVLEEENWIEILQVGANGTVNAYVLNSRAVWTESRDKIYTSRLQTALLASSKEQREPVTNKKSALHQLPRMGELQLPSGAGLPPISQPFFDGMEPNLPTTNSRNE